MGSRRGLSSMFGSRTESEASSVAGKELVPAPDAGSAASPSISPPRSRDLAPTFTTVEDSPHFRNKVTNVQATAYRQKLAGWQCSPELRAVCLPMQLRHSISYCHGRAA